MTFVPLTVPPSPSSDATRYQIRWVAEAFEQESQDALEKAAEAAVDALTDHASDVALGPIAGCNFVDCVIELEFAVEADSTKELYKKLNRITEVLLKKGPFEMQQTSVAKVNPEREPVPA